MTVILDVAGLFSGRISIVGSYLDNHPLTRSSFREIIVLSSAPQKWQVPLNVSSARLVGKYQIHADTIVELPQVIKYDQGLRTRRWDELHVFAKDCALESRFRGATVVLVASSWSFG